MESACAGAEDIILVVISHTHDFDRCETKAFAGDSIDLGMWFAVADFRRDRHKVNSISYGRQAVQYSVQPLVEIRDNAQADARLGETLQRRLDILENLPRLRAAEVVPELLEGALDVWDFGKHAVDDAAPATYLGRVVGGEWSATIVEFAFAEMLGEATLENLR